MAVVFARAPRLGTVKRRLAEDIGQRAALRFHQNTLSALLLRLSRDRRFRTLLSITPDRAHVRAPIRVCIMRQGRGNLGERMDRAFRQSPRTQVALVGCDIPELRPADLQAAFRALGTATAVFGPASDGGYWLVGLSPRRPSRPFANVRWSSPHALTDTLTNFRGRAVAFLRVLHDVDRAKDLIVRS